jgi:hypothetical protein
MLRSRHPAQQRIGIWRGKTRPVAGYVKPRTSGPKLLFAGGAIIVAAALLQMDGSSGSGWSPAAPMSVSAPAATTRNVALPPELAVDAPKDQIRFEPFTELLLPDVTTAGFVPSVPAPTVASDQNPAQVVWSSPPAPIQKPDPISSSTSPASEASVLPDKVSAPLPLPAPAATEPSQPQRSSTPPVLKRDVRRTVDAREIQRRLADADYYSGPASGRWGPSSRAALRRFKAAHQLPADANWDAQTETALFDPEVKQALNFVGIWGPNASACSPRQNKKGFLPAVITEDGAWAGEAVCVFGKRTQSGSRWNISTRCSNPTGRWSSQVRLSVAGDRLSWMSKRGSQNYVRCTRPVITAFRTR